MSIDDSLFLETQFVVENHVLILAKEGYFVTLTIPTQPFENIDNTSSKAFASDWFTSNDVFDFSDDSINSFTYQ